MASSNTSHRSATVLIVEDEGAIRDVYARWLADRYNVRLASSGTEALDHFDESVDIVLLDRRLPDIAGEELLPKLRDRNADCRVAIVSTVEPDYDIIDLGFDLYVEKPVTDPEVLYETIRTLLHRSQFDEKMQEFLSLASKKATLDAAKPPAELWASDEYTELFSKIQSLREELRGVTDVLNDEDLRVAFTCRE